MVGFLNASHWYEINKNDESDYYEPGVNHFDGEKVRFQMRCLTVNVAALCVES